MEPRIEILREKKLIGNCLTMTFAANRTYELWSGFMPRRKEIRAVNSDLISMQVYYRSFDFLHFDLNRPFEKWAAIEVADFSSVPEGMKTFILPEGLYAVFLHKGPASEGPATFGFIFGNWIPNSKYEVDDRPHFEILGSKYKHESPDSEEEIWIPVRPKNNSFTSPPAPPQ